MKTKYPKDGSEVDTFFRWFVSVIFFLALYCLIYWVDESSVAHDEWFYNNFGWSRSDPTPLAKVLWHRLMASIMSGLGIFMVTLLYFRHLYFRIKARIAKSNAEAQDSL